MFGLVSNIVAGLLQSVYGITRGVISNATGALVLRHFDGSGVEVREAGSNTLYWRIGGNAGTPVMQGFLGGSSSRLYF